MKRSISRPATQREIGTTTVELLISVVCTALVTMTMFSMFWMNTVVQTKSGNMLDAANAARVAIERIGKDAREGRTLGDVYGTRVPLDNLVPPTLGTQGTDYFPSDDNPIYGASQTPPGGNWPATWATHAVPAPGRYQLSNQCLIIQVPVYDNNGWPTQIAVGQGNPAVTAAMGNQANVETHIYYLIPDPVTAGEWQLQYFVAPGMAAPGYVPAEHTFGPQTIVKGIVGPLAINPPPNSPNPAAPSVFQFIARRGSLDDPTSSGQPQYVVNGATLPNFTGVIVNLEVIKRESGVSRPSTLAFKQEVFIRNNAMSTSVGQPP